jgi:kinetochor protein Mis14/NSL1
MESESVVSGHHRKIELQAPEDLTYLLANVRRAATARIDEAFPPVEGAGEDELRTRIEELIDEVIARPPNLSTAKSLFLLLLLLLPPAHPHS